MKIEIENGEKRAIIEVWLEKEGAEIAVVAKRCGAPHGVFVIKKIGFRLDDKGQLKIN